MLPQNASENNWGPLYHIITIKYENEWMSKGFFQLSFHKKCLVGRGVVKEKGGKP